MGKEQFLNDWHRNLNAKGNAKQVSLYAIELFFLKKKTPVLSFYITKMFQLSLSSVVKECKIRTFNANIIVAWTGIYIYMQQN